MSGARGWRRAEICRRRGFTRAQVADLIGVGTSRVSQIATGKVSTRKLLDRYVEALAANLARHGLLPMSLPMGIAQQQRPREAQTRMRGSLCR